MVRLQRSSTLACQLCLASLRPPPVTRLPSRALSTSLPRRSPSSTPPTSPIQSQLTSLLTTLNLSARFRARAFSSALAALELQRKLGEVGGKINQATGYEEIERLRVGVGSRERALLEVRERATVAKRAYGVAVALRAASQKEVNDLLQRKSSWTGSDVMRFTELVQQDHENEKDEARAKEEMDLGEEGVEKGFSDLMQAILERYHEEQVWSDKIRSLSTYGSLAITSLNVLLFIITILLVEPWKRKRLVEGVEARLRSSTIEGHEATLASLLTLQTLLHDAQTKLDLLLPSAAPPTSPSTTDEPDQVQGSDEQVLYPFTEGGTVELAEEVVEKTPPSISTIGGVEKELLIVGATGTVVGLVLSGLIGLLTR